MNGADKIVKALDAECNLNEKIEEEELKDFDQQEDPGHDIKRDKFREKPPKINFVRVLVSFFLSF